MPPATTTMPVGPEATADAAASITEEMLRRAAATPIADAASPCWWNVLGTGSVFQSDGGQTTTKARPMTSLAGIVPSWSCMCARESALPPRLSPMTHSRPLGTVTSNGVSEGFAPG